MSARITAVRFKYTIDNPRRSPVVNKLNMKDLDDDLHGVETVRDRISFALIFTNIIDPDHYSDLAPTLF